MMAMQSYAGDQFNDHGGNHGIDHVLLISIDGMHALDYLNCVSGGYCPNLAALGKRGVNYLNTSTSKPSDSFPGLMALMTGGTPRTMVSTTMSLTTARSIRRRRRPATGC
jgi:predicted AlkP superfamily pyrophosphatase or phosphodiesterase